jgi:hypothetical protein
VTWRCETFVCLVTHARCHVDIGDNVKSCGEIVVDKAVPTLGRPSPLAHCLQVDLGSLVSLCRLRRCGWGSAGHVWGPGSRHH